MTRIVLAQRAHLIGELAARGIDAHCVIVADDDNLDIAREHGFATVEMDNSDLGAKFNAGMRYACVEGGATHVVSIGSDDWVHPDVFDVLPEPPYVQTRARLALVDLPTGQLSLAHVSRETGSIPWIVPRAMLEACSFRPIPPGKRRGMDWWLTQGLHGRTGGRRQSVQWLHHDPHALAAVDWKCGANLTPYSRLARNPFVRERDDYPWPRLRELYPDTLVDLAYATHLGMRSGRIEVGDAPPVPPVRRARRRGAPAPVPLAPAASHPRPSRRPRRTIPAPKCPAGERRRAASER